MLIRKPLRPNALVAIGCAFLAVSINLLTLVGRAHKTTNMTDFVLGIAFGVGIGVLVLAVIARARRS